MGQLIGLVFIGAGLLTAYIFLEIKKIFAFFLKSDEDENQEKHK